MKMELIVEFHRNASEEEVVSLQVFLKIAMNHGNIPVKSADSVNLQTDFVIYFYFIIAS